MPELICTPPLSSAPCYGKRAQFWITPWTSPWATISVSAVEISEGEPTDRRSGHGALPGPRGFLALSLVRVTGHVPTVQIE